MYSTVKFMPTPYFELQHNSYQSLFQNTILGVAVVCPQNGKFLDANPAFCNMLGYSREELLATDVKSITYADDIETHKHIASKENTFKSLKLNRSQAHFQIEKRYIKKNGDLFYGQATITAIFDADGNHIEDFAIIRDISQEITTKETYFDLFDNSPDLIYVLDEKATFITVNQSVVEKYGYPKDFAIGKTPEIFGAPGMNDMQKVGAAIQKAWEGEPQHLDWWSLTGDGHIFPKELVLKKGKYFGKDVLIATGRDISQRYEMEQKLQETNEQLQKVNDEITNFIYRASHDLRSPVASLQGLLQVMRYTQKPEELEKYMGIMESQLKKMDNSISEIIDYRKITTSEIEENEIDIKRLIDEILDPLCFSEGFDSIKKEITVNLSVPLVTDKQRITIILYNLISNAIKYYDKNKSDSYIRILISEDTQNQVSIVVEDNGIGIGEEHHKRIFEMFYRATNQVKGTGLGLSIVKGAIEKLGGNITLASEQGKGCKFTIKFPNLHRI